MVEIEVKCPKCGETLLLDTSKNCWFCKFCGEKIVFGNEEENGKYDSENKCDSDSGRKIKITINRQKMTMTCSFAAYNVLFDGAAIGKLGPGKSLVIETTPGNHTITVFVRGVIGKSISISYDMTSDTDYYTGDRMGIPYISAEKP